MLWRRDFSKHRQATGPDHHGKPPAPDFLLEQDFEQHIG